MLSDRSDRIPALIAITVSARLVRLLPWLLLGWGLIGADSARSDEGIKFDAVWEGEFVAVSATADLPVEAATVWSVLTDYDRFAEFIPDMVSSRIVSRSRDGLVVEQRGEFGFLFFRQPVHLVLDVVLDSPRRMHSRSIAGDLRDMTSSFQISETPQALRLSYEARFLPAISLPPFIGLAIVRHQMEKQFAAMVREILRRGALESGNSRAEAAR
jgi:ribosome-associated toxin RatA of RatAB toxin-antitoxin module